MSMHTGAEFRTPADRVKALREPGRRAPVEDSPSWHLRAAAEALDARRWDTARAAIQRARENGEAGSAEEYEACFLALRLAVAVVDPRSAIAEISTLTSQGDPSDPVRIQRATTIILNAPHLPASIRQTLLDLLGGGSPSLPAHGDAAAASVPEPDLTLALPALPGEDEPWQSDDVVPEDAAEPWPPPIPTADPFEPATQIPPSPGGDEVLMLRLEELPDSDEPPAFTAQVVVDGGLDLTNADVLRERLVETMLAAVTAEEAQLLFETATTFLNNGQYDSAELLFSAAMQMPGLRVAACEGQMQALVRAGRTTEAVATGLRATRIFVREGDALLGIVYWMGIAAHASDDMNTARTCFDRIAASPHAARFPDLQNRIATLR